MTVVAPVHSRAPRDCFCKLEDPGFGACSWLVTSTTSWEPCRNQHFEYLLRKTEVTALRSRSVLCAWSK